MMKHDAQEDDDAVAAFMGTLGQAPLAGDQSPVDPHLIWWKARIARQFQTQQAAALVLECGSALTILSVAVLGLIAATLLAFGAFGTDSPPQGAPLALTILGFLATGLAAARSVWTLSIQRA